MTTNPQRRSARAPEEGGGPAEELTYRLRQQELLAQFGLYALKCKDLDGLLHEATRLCAAGLRTSACKALRYVAEDDRLLVRAGVGWAAEVVGEASLGADPSSPAGYALRTGEPVISSHLGAKSRFRTPKLLAEHGVKRAINVAIRGDGAPFGVLEVDSPDDDRFTPADLAFVQGFANLLGVAIERHRSETELRESEEEIRLVVEGAADYAIIGIDDDGRITSWSPGARAIFGWVAKEIVGQGFAVLFTPEDRSRHVPAAELATAREKGCAEDERWHLRRDGARIWVSGSVRLLHDASGHARGFLKVARDLTDRRRAAEALAESERQLRTLADSIPQLAWMADPEGRRFWFNRRWYDYTGTTLEDVQGWNWRKLHDPDQVAHATARIRHSLDTGEPWEDTVRLRGRDGQYRWFLSRAVPVRDAGGRVVRWFGTNTDITEQREAEERQRLLLQELNHRVKNTIATVQGIARQTQRGAESLESFMQVFEARLGAIAKTHNLLTASQWQGADLRDIIVEELAPYRGTTADARARIAGEPVALPPTTALMAGMVFHELTTNAVKYGALSVPSGRLDVTWHVAESPEGCRLHLAWTESGGPPVAPPKRRGFGSRLIERGLTQELGGTIRLDFAPEGLRCTMDLPLPEGAC